MARGGVGATRSTPQRPQERSESNPRIIPFFYLGPLLVVAHCRPHPGRWRHGRRVRHIAERCATWMGDTSAQRGHVESQAQSASLRLLLTCRNASCLRPLDQVNWFGLRDPVAWISDDRRCLRVPSRTCTRTRKQAQSCRSQLSAQPAIEWMRRGIRTRVGLLQRCATERGKSPAQA